MLSIARLKLEVLGNIRYHRRSLLAFHVYFAILMVVVLVPASAWLLTALVTLTGTSLIGNEDLLRFLLQPSGLAWALISLTLLAVAVFFQHAGMMLITTRNREGKFHTAAQALWYLLLHSKAILALAMLQVAIHLVLLVPVLLAVGWAFQHFLGGYDIYYVINAHPPEMWWFLACFTFASLWVLLIHGNLYLRWAMALPAMILENRGPVSALNRSAELTLGTRRRIALTLLSVAAVLASLPFLVSWLFDGLGWTLFSLLPDQDRIIALTVLVLLVSYALSNLLAGFIAVSGNSLTLLRLYHQYCEDQGVSEKACPSQTQEPRNTGVFAIGIEVVLVVFALVQVTYAVQQFRPAEEVLNIAHRGNSWDAPENTLAAIERAIVDGADYVELDVRHTADGQLVLIHDRDMLRIAGEPRPIWMVDFSEVQDRDIGSWFAPEFSNERLPTLAQAVELLRGRAGLYLEVKGAPQMPDLVPMVVAELRRLEFIDETILASLAPADLAAARAIEPQLRTSLLVHTSVGRLAGQDVDMYGIRAALATPRNLNRLRAQEQGVHVWTVNDVAGMERMIDIGVDGIITDRPDVLADVLQQRAELNPVERWLLRFRYRLW
ncbi:MAG: glycerophosphoryl diester phosphodiesterase membrane domain-containing protein [Aliidiomarina sp.]|uniref:glycerophosphodiester phosphodiesterase family protein n=1 Tax=Aliidiomarina sp. TaxID=1872439 RepID=UPI0025B94BC4|nr:glycerophosphodiester phosphodiesterase family protein [Aliidiomarina sp.]MCH8501321.1 glycerophosphoryl diester phosphodiesterase membrane domain-containing protein [Aliidiomarina sp.]